MLRDKSRHILNTLCSMVLVLILYGTGYPAQLTWTQRTAPVNANLTRIVYGNGYFVAVGEGSTVMVSQDGENWTRGHLLPSAGKALPRRSHPPQGRPGTRCRSQHPSLWGPQVLEMACT